MTPSSFRRLHRWIGLTCALTALLATGSGILHTVMTWTQPPPPRPEPAAAFAAATVLFPVSALPADLGAIRSLQIQSLDADAWYQVSTATGPRYFSTRDGHEDPTVETRLALAIARRYLGNSAGFTADALSYTRRLTAYDSEYISIFRLLPVHRIDVADGRGTRLYVSTQTGSVARHTDDSRQFEANVFSLFHKYAFISTKGMRDGVLVTFTAITFLASLTGVILFFVTLRRRA
jgi:PepSY-associated TM region